MKIHTPRTDLGQQSHDVVRRNRWTHRLAKRITSTVSHGPQSKRKFVLRPRLVITAGHEVSLKIFEMPQYEQESPVRPGAWYTLGPAANVAAWSLRIPDFLPRSF